VSTIPEVKARLLVAGTPFSAALGATSYAQVKDRPSVTLPCVYAFFAEEVTADNERMTGKVRQRSERDLVLVYVVEHAGDADGGDVADPLEDIKTFGRGQVLGFKPSDMVDPITHIRGAVIEAVDGVVWFADTFSAPIYLKETT
jgi:hypothetical protein